MRDARTVIIPDIQWECRVYSPDGRHDYTVPAAVPGCVHNDLLAAGVISDPFPGKEAERVQWIEQCDATYTGHFTWNGPVDDITLIFYGIDCYATVCLNGHLLGRCDNMFTRHTFSVEPALKVGENVLTVALRSPIREVEGLPLRSGAFTKERLYTRRIQCTYGWDWVARFVTMGIWRPIAFVKHEADMLTDDRFGIGNEGIYVYTKSLHALGAKIGLALRFQHVTGNGWVSMEIIAPDGQTVVWSKKRRILATTDTERAEITENVDIAMPQLWFPTGYGDQPMYTLTCRTFDHQGVQTSEKVLSFGIRTVEIVETEDEPDSDWANLARKVKKYEHLAYWDKNEGSSRFCVLINDVPVFCQGADWVPCEPFPSSETPEKISRLVMLAKEAGVNMLRVWGGGIFENDAFYTACDKAGILVTQDFLMACGHYPEEDAAFMAHLEQETIEAALALRNHPSLVWWSGDNENAVEGNENLAEYRGRRAALCAIEPLLKQFDPHRRFLPSSPYGGIPYASAVRGTTHNTQFLGTLFKWIREADNGLGWSDYREHMDQYLDRFGVEQPSMGMPFASCLKKFMTDDEIFGEDTSVSEYHTKNNPGIGKITLYEYVDRMARGIFGEYKNGSDRVNKMQLLQCEWIRLSMELARRNAWYSSGILYWMWNDCWPAANSWSIVDYYAMPKPAYYAFMRCAKPVIASILPNDANRTKVFVCYQGSGRRAEGQLRLYRYELSSGTEHTIQVVPLSQEPGCSQIVVDVPALDMQDGSILIADVHTTAGDDRAFSLPYKHRFADIQLDAGELTVIAEDEQSITLHAQRTTPFAMIDRDGRVYRGFGEFMKAGEVRQFERIIFPECLESSCNTV